MIQCNFYRRVLLVAVLFFVCVCFAGCFSSKFTLGKAEDAKVDIGYVGNWEMSQDGHKVTLVIRNLDNHWYYVEYLDEKDADKGPARYTGFVTPVGGVQFAQLRALNADGTIAEDYGIVRVGMKEGALTFQHLKEDFFKDKTINSSDDLRKIVEANVENKSMYDDDVAKLTRTPGDHQ
jgi:hypothetical protein